MDANLSNIDKRPELSSYDVRAEDRARLVGVLREAGMALPSGLGAGSPWSDALESAVHGFLARTRSAIAMAQLDDLAGNLDQVNLPGGAGVGLAGAPSTARNERSPRP